MGGGGQAAASPLHAVVGYLAANGSATAAELADVAGRSQPTVSRLLAELGSEVVSVGRGRATRYLRPKSIHGRLGENPLIWTDEQGRRTQVGALSFLANDTVYVHSAQFGDFQGASLPWYLSPLRAEGFLGRLAARAMTSLGVEDNPERWALETVLYAALQVHDAPGAITLGLQDTGEPLFRLSASELHDQLDAAAAAVAATLPAGSSAGGEQPKFLACHADLGHVIVKFTPPLNTPGGRRWADLLRAEQLATATLQRHGIGAALSHLVHTSARAYLVSERFDRLGAHGRRHAVAIGQVHAAFLSGTYRNWAETGAALAARRMLPPSHAEAIAFVRNYGRLIGNTDMHSGNLALFVAAADVRRGRFELAPIYDMLPMRWRPDVQFGIQDYSPFALDDALLSSPAAEAAATFWGALAQQPDVSAALREVAVNMAERFPR